MLICIFLNSLYNLCATASAGDKGVGQTYILIVLPFVPFLNEQNFQNFKSTVHPQL